MTPEFRDFIKLILASASGIIDPPKIIGRTEVKVEEGILIVSTVMTPDCGAETAILDAKGNYPVERYENEEKAILGHANWVEKAKSLKTVIKLGYGKSIQDIEITIKAINDN